MKKVRKPGTLLLVIVIIFMIVFQGSAVFASTRFQEVMTRFTNVFIHTGRVEHEHVYAFDGGMAGFFAAGMGSASGVHDGWSVAAKVTPAQAVYDNYKYVSSYGYFHGATARDALPGQYMRIISGTSIQDWHNSSVGVMPKPGEKGYVSDTISSSYNKRDGENYYYLRHSSGAGTSDGITRVSKETNDSTTTINVDGYSQILETYIEDSGGSKVGWWSLP
ncbi:MAG: hypothetical protein FJ152_00720 [Firmicutes bacterium]|nr:hypothetical protein [Bacillota bacterium]